MNKFYGAITLIFALLSSLSSFAQSIKGFVYDKETGEPVLYANVVIVDSKVGTSTDVNGYYSLTNLKPGSHQIQASFVGYRSSIVNIELKKGKTVTKNIYLEPDNMLGAIELSDELEVKRTETTVSKIKITPQEIKRLPSIGGQADLAQYVQVIPGVVFTGDQGGQLYIRGGSPIQNLVLLDGMTIYAPFHSIGFSSVFDTELIKSTEIYTAAFGAEYGERMSSVMDIKTRDGNRRRLSGRIGINTFGAGISLQGPLSKRKEDGLAGTSFVMSAKTSYIDQTSKSIYKYALRDGESSIPFVYNDFYAKITSTSKSGSKASAFGFSFNDQVNYSSQTNFDWKARGGGGNLLAILPNSLSILNFNVTYSGFEMTETGKEKNEDGVLEDKSPKTSSIEEFKLKFDIGRNIDDNKSYKFGVLLGFGTTDFEFKNKSLSNFKLSDNTDILGAYYKFKYNSTLWVVEPSVRMNYYVRLQAPTIEPRLSIKYNATDVFRLKGSAGLYSQNLIAANNGRQVVNLFNGFTSSPKDVPTTFLGENVNSQIQKAWHGVFGFEWDINDKLEANVEGFYKDNYQLVNINLDKINKTESVAHYPDYRFTEFVYEKGRALGVDVSLKYSAKRFNVNTSYSISKVEFTNEEYTYAPFFDRRHNLNITTGYYLDKEKTLSLDGRFNYGTGFPFPQIIGSYTGVDLTDIGNDYITVNGDNIKVSDRPDSGRLPAYARLDLSLTKTWVLGKQQKLETNFTITNALNRKNIFYYDKQSEERVNQLPIFPSFGASWSF
jgi:hypothetical protein